MSAELGEPVARLDVVCAQPLDELSYLGMLLLDNLAVGIVAGAGSVNRSFGHGEFPPKYFRVQPDCRARTSLLTSQHGDFRTSTSVDRCPVSCTTLARHHALGPSR